MATASELKVKVAKISTIVEYLEDEQISQIEKDILLQAVRELYSDILVTNITKTKVENTQPEEKTGNEQQETIAEHVDENVAETVAAAVVPPVISVAFDDGEFDFSDLLKDKTTEENAEVQEENVETEVPVENVATEEVPAEEDFPVEEPEAEEENEEPVTEFVPDEIDEQEPESEDEFDEPEPENIEEVDSVEEFGEDNDDSDDLDDVEPETSEEIEDEALDSVSESNFEETATGDTEIHYSFNEEPLQEEQPIVEAEEPQKEETPVVEEVPVVEETPIVEVEEPVAEEPQVVAEMPTVEEPVAESPQVVEEKSVEQEKPEAAHITLGEQLGQSRQSSLYDKFASNKPAEGSYGLKPISDIKSAIPLGERFRFTRMLFSGNGPAFDSTVATLNGMSSMEEADNYVRTNFSWDMESPVVVDFMNIVRRRFL